MHPGSEWLPCLRELRYNTQYVLHMYRESRYLSACISRHICFEAPALLVCGCLPSGSFSTVMCMLVGSLCLLMCMLSGGLSVHA